MFGSPNLVLCFLFPNQFVINSHPIAKSLIHWYSGAKRELPWRKTREPYVIWISEIILQQTRVDQGLPYFERFIESFPSVHKLASASEDDVLANWQGLGYYSRARNLHTTAKYVSEKLNGHFPKTYAELLRLKGIGPYTAAAISSICFDRPEPVVDGNVFRVASRIFGVADDISKSSTRKVFTDILKKIIPHGQPGEFNQAIMEHGATVCKPRPACGECTLSQFCHAFKENRATDFPVKGKKTTVRNRNLFYLVLERDGRVLMKKRKGQDIWQGLYDFPQAESGEIKVGNHAPLVTDPIIHLLSHQKLHVRFLRFPDLAQQEFDKLARSYTCEAFSFKQIVALPKPKVIVDFVQKTFGTKDN